MLDSRARRKPDSYDQKDLPLLGTTARSTPAMGEEGEWRSILPVSPRAQRGSNSLKLKHRGQDLSSVEVRATSRAAASAAASLGAKEGLDQLT